MAKIELTILGKPFGKQAIIKTRWKSFFPKETENYRALVQYIFQDKYPDTYLEGALFATVTAYYPIPKSMPKYKRLLALTCKLFPTKKPDIDNLQKMLFDSLNKKAYYDDAQIVGVYIMKYYSDKPRIELTIEELYDSPKDKAYK